MSFGVLDFFKFAPPPPPPPPKNASDCTDFSLDFQNFPEEHAPGPAPRNVLFFFFL